VTGSGFLWLVRNFNTQGSTYSRPEDSAARGCGFWGGFGVGSVLLGGTKAKGCASGLARRFE
jgi:hypothetical protein